LAQVYKKDYPVLYTLFICRKALPGGEKKERISEKCG
jgi:hypothetical protein